MQWSSNIMNTNQTLRNTAGKKSIITKSYAGNEGKIVTCTRLATEEELNTIGGRFPKKYGPYWVMDRPMRAGNGQVHCFAGDKQMTPLQDLDEPEQQVQELYAPSPSEVLDEVN